MGKHKIKMPDLKYKGLPHPQRVNMINVEEIMQGFKKRN